MTFYLNPNDITNGEILLLIALQEKRTAIKTSDILLLVLATRALLHSFGFRILYSSNFLKRRLFGCIHEVYRLRQYLKAMLLPLIRKSIHQLQTLEVQQYVLMHNTIQCYNSSDTRNLA